MSDDVDKQMNIRQCILWMYKADLQNRFPSCIYFILHKVLQKSTHNSDTHSLSRNTERE